MLLYANLTTKYLTKIEVLMQTGSTALYANQFLKCLAYLNWTEETKLMQFNCSLKPNLLCALTITKCESTLEKWILVIVLVDNNLYEIDQELKCCGANQTSHPLPSHSSYMIRNPHNTCAPNLLSTTTITMTSSTVSTSCLCGPLTKAEKEQHCKSNLCFYCGEGSHTFKNCPKKNPTILDSRSVGKA
ncbi:hypothetical protein C8Q77DRAFT_1044503 [Trametes polyzona]|nr:hypothetical protein C8Q77DRAFT_1044503 [Trametes polyzona]